LGILDLAGRAFFDAVLFDSKLVGFTCRAHGAARTWATQREFVLASAPAPALHAPPGFRCCSALRSHAVRIVSEAALAAYLR